MPASNDQVPKLALLIDADNISSKYLSTILSEVPKHGIATYRRIYGDFTDPQAASWRTKLLDNSITPVQQFSNVKSHKPGESAGKNATDSTLIIDAMDILYAGRVDGFIIVSSDSDFTRLAQRLRESGMHVVGMGRNQTSMSFRRACTTFVNIELLASREETLAAKDEDTDLGGSATKELTLKDVERVVAGIVRNNDGKGEETLLGAVGKGLHNRYPDFDVRTFGYTKLSKLIGDMPRFEIVDKGGVHYVSFADTRDLQTRVQAFVRERLAKEPNKTMLLSALANELYQAFPDFSLKDVGYAQFYKFADSIKGVKVVGADRQRARLVK